MVIRAEHVQGLVEPAIELVDQVGEIGCEVGRGSVAPQDDAVLVVTEGLGDEPGRPVALDEVPAAAGALDRSLHVAGVVERGLVRPDVHRDAEPGEGLADEREHRLGAGAGELGRRRVRPEAGLLGDRDQVLALVALLVRLLAPRPGEQRSAEVLHLRACVIEVVLAHDVVPRELEQPGQAVAVRGVATGRDGQRARGIGRHELDVDPEPVRRRAAAESGFDRRLDRLRVPDRRGAKVEEPGAGNLGACDPRTRRRRLAQSLGDLARRTA